ncbi:MAG: toprim domain-containing protein [Chthoniobacterales bacterium]
MIKVHHGFEQIRIAQLYFRLDALSLWCHGFANVTWSYGVNGFTPDHWQLMRESRPDRVVICYDNDEAGNRAANELAQKIEPEGVAVWRVELPPRSDINDLIRASKDPRAALASLLAAATRMQPAPDVPSLGGCERAPAPALRPKLRATFPPRG